jgi:hypothetical protein
MPLYRATALIAVMIMILLSAGYAAAERSGEEQGLSGTSPQESRSARAS